jgi:hydrogenase large subunit
MARLVVDPITRIEGHLRIEANLDANNTITDAYSSGTMVRGIEIILRDRDPREAWAFTQRACGVCTTVHAFASIRSVEDALGIEIPESANLVRNLMIAQQYVHDHVMHFYHLHALDWVDVVAALQADPQKTSEIQQSISSWPNSSPGYFSDVQQRIQNLVNMGTLSLFTNGYWGHPAYKLPPEVDLLAVAHYLEALDWQKDVVRLHTIFGGKNPHPNFLVGGVPMSFDPNSDVGLNAERLTMIQQVINSLNTFVDQVYIPDLLAIAPYYLDYALLGEGLGNFLSYGEFPLNKSNDFSNGNLLVPRGAILDRTLELQEVDPKDVTQIEEFIKHSWYKYGQGNDAGLHPFDGETKFAYDAQGGPKPPFEELNVDQGYTWLKAPRWKGNAMEVGPLARVLMMYVAGNQATVDLVTAVLDTLNKSPQAADAGLDGKITTDHLFSTLGRTAARGIETDVFVHEMMGWFNQLVTNLGAGKTDNWNGAKWSPNDWPDTAEGFGFLEAPRGALGHWVVIRDGKIDNYQMVVPTTWNASPRDGNEQPGAYEMSLVGTSLAVPDQPLEILRTIHSFDPCMACAVHLIDVNGNALEDVDASNGLSCCVS